jgi:N-acetylglucosamine kinase-like BadF-type ATPase
MTVIAGPDIGRMMVIAGLDIGGTKTHVRLETPDGRLVADAVEPSGDWSATAPAAAARWIAGTVRRHLPPGATIAAIGAGAQGCNTAEHCAQLNAELAAAAGAPAAATNDAALLVPAAGLACGIGVIAGTGSIAVALRPGGALAFAGGWGWVIGDEGSAPALVRDATRAALARHDAGAAPDVLLPMLLEAFGVGGAAALARAVNDTPTAAHWGSRAPAVFAAAERGSADARAVVAGGAEALAGLVALLARDAGPSADVVAAGGVMAGQPMFYAAFRAAVARSNPGLSVHLLREPPVTGAVTLARRLLSTRPAARPDARS